MSNSVEKSDDSPSEDTVQNPDREEPCQLQENKSPISENLSAVPKTDTPIRKSTKHIERHSGEHADLYVALRCTSNQLRTRTNVSTIINLRNYLDPYTKNNLSLENGKLPNGYDVDHIHEVQVLIYAVNEIKAFSTKTIECLRAEVNDVSNLVITTCGVNRSKGQAMKYFLNHVEKENEFSLLTALVQTSSGKERQIASYSGYIVDLIKNTSSTMSDRIRHIRRDDGHVTDNSIYELVADKFDSLVLKMDLDRTDAVKLRSGRTYYPPR
ncbi:unnamed protein product [Adineta ricciae]|uniref:Uncharacterized protein n=1 Tax=Adineta ricciae TaxID=249248 RepID=A0A813ZX96_ADIRI|nr:unnamed protein product [Adineta ricciae]